VTAVAGERRPEEAGAPAAATALDGADLTVVTSWADAIADALEHAPQAVDELLAEARAGAAWRAELGVPEPGAPLATALAAVADAVGGAGAGGNRDVAILGALRQERPADDAAASLGLAVLRAALEARVDVRVAVPLER
jgi:hypothetical protein